MPGCRSAADVYPYTWSGTGLSSNVPAHWHEGGPEALYDRLDDRATRARIRAEMVAIGRYGDTPNAEDVLLLRLKHPDNASLARPYSCRDRRRPSAGPRRHRA